jgi:competence protein ComEC
VPRALLVAALSVVATLVARLATRDGIGASCVIGAALAVAGAGSAAAVAWRRSPARQRLLAAAALALCLALSLARGAGESARERLHRLAWPAGEMHAGWVRGRLVAEPRRDARGWRGLVAVEQSTLTLPRGTRLSLRATGGPAPAPHARLEAYVEVERPPESVAPGGFPAARWLAAQGASAWGRVRGASWRALEPPRPSLSSFLSAWRARLIARTSEHLPGEAGGLLRGLLLGERDAVSPEAIEEFRRAGVLHLLALSGQHVALVASLLRGVAGWLRLGARAATFGVGAGIWGYALLTGGSASVVRASIAATVALAGRAACRPVASWSALAWSAVLGPLAAPHLVADVGFQLSCLASAGLVLAARWRGAARFADPLWALPASGGAAARRAVASVVARPLFFAGGLLLATTAAQLAVLPLLALHFGVVSAVGLASNLVLVPASTALLAAGLPLLFLDPLLPLPGGLWRSLGLGAAAVLDLGRWFADLPGAELVCTLTPWAAGVALAAVALAVALGALASTSSGAGPDRGAALRVAGATAAIGLWIGLTSAAFAPRPPAPEATLLHWVLDVGQGDAQVLEFADGFTLVVDAGEGGVGPPGARDAGRSVVAPFLRARSRTRVECAVLTHEDRDHAGGFESLARAVRVEELASGEGTLAALAERGVLRSFRGRCRALARGETLRATPHYAVRVLWPPRPCLEASANNRSVVLLVEVGEERILLTGDADSTVENRWAADLRGPVALLKLGHHGSRSSTGHTLLARARPRYAACSAGRANRFGHPHAETLARLDASAIAVERTDRQGTLRFAFGVRPALAAGPPRRTPAP